MDGWDVDHVVEHFLRLGADEDDVATLRKEKIE